MEKSIQVCCTYTVAHSELTLVQLRDFWDAEITKDGEPARINIMKGLSKMTLDVIGLAGQ